MVTWRNKTFIPKDKKREILSHKFNVQYIFQISKANRIEEQMILGRGYMYWFRNLIRSHIKYFCTQYCHRYQKRLTKQIGGKKAKSNNIHNTLWFCVFHTFLIKYTRDNVSKSNNSLIQEKIKLMLFLYLIWQHILLHETREFSKLIVKEIHLLLHNILEHIKSIYCTQQNVRMCAALYFYDLLLSFFCLLSPNSYLSPPPFF